jgi:hypothetical protein
MTNLFRAEKVNGKLVAKCIETGSIAPEGMIRDVQIRNAFKEKAVLAVNPESGRVTRLAGEIFADSKKFKNAKSDKMNFMEVVQKRDPKLMFDNLERLTKMVGKGIQPSLLITGSAGLGKTFLVKRTLENIGLKESYGFVHFKGRATAAGLFSTLYEHSNSVIVLDDCDSVFKDPDAVNILKAALDSYDTRRISYLSTKPIKDADGNPVPRSFEFTGKIIFISNISQSNLDDAIKSRSFVADISMNTEQMFQRIEDLIETMEPRIPLPQKRKALAIMRRLNDRYDGVEINLRSFIKAARICAMGFESPESLVAEQIISV